MPENQAAAPDALAPVVDNFGFPLAGDLSTEDMSDAELEAFVDKALGVNRGKSNTPAEAKPVDVKPAGTVEPPTVAKPAEAVAVANPPQPPVAEEETQVDIPALDTSDLWIEVTKQDGTKAKLTFDQGIPDDFLFTNDKQLFEVLDAFQEMKDLRAQREAAIEKATVAKAAAEADQTTQASTMTGWANEIQDLVDAGLIPATPAMPADGKQYSQAEIAADPGLKMTNDVFAYMKAENDKRSTAGRAPLTSFAAAFTLYKKESDTAAEAARQTETNRIVKQRGAIVGGTSAPAADSGKGYVYKRGSAKNIWAVDTSDI